MAEIYIVDVTNRDGVQTANLGLARYTNVESQRPLVEDDLLFIAKYTEIARELLTLIPLEA